MRRDRRAGTHALRIRLASPIMYYRGDSPEGARTRAPGVADRDRSAYYARTRAPARCGWNGARIVHRCGFVNGVVIGRMAMVIVMGPACEDARPPDTFESVGDVIPGRSPRAGMLRMEWCAD
jgi:hypothetical protein